MQTITLGGKDYSITTPLTIGQLMSLRVAVSQPIADTAEDEVKRDLDRSFGILSAAITPENTEFTREYFDGIRTDFRELAGVVNTILELSGLVAAKAAPAGEAKPPEAGA